MDKIALRLAKVISIHALRGEGDGNSVFDFVCLDKFQSTPSVGRATMALKFAIQTVFISIHALRGEGD